MKSEHRRRWLVVARSVALIALNLALLGGLAFWLAPRRSSGPLHQRAYIWQREWTSAVDGAISQAAPHLDGFIVLGAEVAWKDGTPRVTRPPVDWTALQKAEKPVGICLRIDPFDPATHAGATRLVTDLVKSLIREARDHGVPCAEFQVDFDCASRKLAGYRSWLPALREAARPARFVITTLPAWLDEPEMAKLVAGADGFVLQVHSVPTRREGENVALFDAARAQRWVARAAKLGRPFTVSLPTYSALIGYDRQGKSLGMALDGVQPSWPPGTHVIEFTSDATELSRLVAQWRKDRPTNMEGIAWYRLPIDGKRNWRWPTFAAVMEGREPTHQLDVLTAGDNPVDLSLTNQGEAEENLAVAVRVRWDGSAGAVAEALRGWTVSQSEHEVRFTRTETAVPRLLPGGRRDIGWLRFDQPTHPYAEILH